jgi:hypothetical protein
MKTGWDEFLPAAPEYGRETKPGEKPLEQLAAEVPRVGVNADPVDLVAE